MILSGKKVTQLLESGFIFSKYNPEDLEDCSIKVHLSNSVFKYPKDIILEQGQSYKMIETLIPDEGLVIKPNEFYITYLSEEINFPDNIFGLISTAGSVAKLGLQIHLSDMHIDPNSKGKITLQLKNQGHNPIKISKGMYIAKVYLFEVQKSVI